jgi:hypothetical protein
MSPIEDEIRDTLRSKADSLCEVRPLRLPAVAAVAAAHEPRAVPRIPWARRLRAWQAPAVAAAVIVLVAGSLVTLKSLRNEYAGPAASGSLPVTAGAAPRYYVALGWAKNPGTSVIIVGDERYGKTIATFPLLPKGDVLTSGAVSAAADDRMFVVSGVTSRGDATPGPDTWHLVRIPRDSADPVRITKLPIKSPVDENVRDIALSGDGTELAVVSMPANASSRGRTPVTLQVYSVATGRLQHSWSAGISASLADSEPIADLSWVGDSTVGFAVTYTPQVREEVRTLDVSKTGANLLADSHIVWSQYVHPTRLATGEPVHGLVRIGVLPVRHACDTPFLTGNGQAVVCGNSTYSPSDKRWSAMWLAYPLATPTRPRVIGSVQEPRDVSGFNGPISVDWTNPDGTAVIGSWNAFVPMPGGGSVANYEAVVGNGKFNLFPRIPDFLVGW